MKKKVTYTQLVLLFLGLAFYSCDKGDDDVKPIVETKTNEFIAMIKVGESSYLGSFTDLNVKNIDTKKSFELITGGVPYYYEDFVFYAEGLVGNKIHKYIKTKDGELEAKGVMTMPSSSFPAEMTFVSKTKAYVSLNGLGKLAVINPTTMKIDKQIDLSSYAVGDNNPDPGVSIIRDGKLFLALNQKKSQMSVFPNAYVLVIDINTDEIEKVIIDKRATAIGMFCHSRVLTDEQGHIYFYANGMFGFQPDAKEGFLRIKKGETEWDKDYFCSIKEMDIEGVPGNKGSYTLSFEYGGNGDVYMDIQIPALGTNPPDFVNTRDYQPFKINLFTKKAEKLDLPATAGWAAWGICQKGDQVIFALSTKTANGLYTYNKKTGKCSKEAVVNVAGIPGHIEYIGK